MALPPKFGGHRLVFSDPTATPPGSALAEHHTVEIYLDYVCPYSEKMFNVIYNTLPPLIRADPSLRDRVHFIFRQQVQPWHPSSTLTHEAALAVLRLAPDRFWDFSRALFAVQRDYFDLRVVGEARNATYARLAKLAATVADGNSASANALSEDAVLRLLRVRELKPGEAEPEELNGGNEVTADMKTIVKMARLTGVHVSPTVIVDGVVANDISSSWSAEQWVEHLKKVVG